jgi:S1-C subfamily serine protease
VVVASARGGGNAVKRPWLGAKLQNVTPEIAEGLGLKRNSGALVAGVSNNSPAARAGIKTGDVIVSIEELVVEDQNGFDYRFGTRPLGGQARIGLIRGGQEITVVVALQSAPDGPREELVIRSRSPLSGAKVGNLSPALAEELRLDPSAEGVVVLELGKGSIAQRLGFKRGDVVLAINDKRVSSSKDLEKATRDPARFWEITILRGGRQVTAQFPG